MNLPTPKYKIGDTVYTSSYTTEDVFCTTCKQPTYPTEGDDDWMDRNVIIVTEHVIRGCAVRQGMDYDGVSYRLSKNQWDINEEHVYFTSAGARHAIERQFQEIILDRRAKNRS